MLHDNEKYTVIEEEEEGGQGTAAENDLCIIC